MSSTAQSTLDEPFPTERSAAAFANTMAPVFDIVLRAADGFDEYHERKLTLRPGNRITVGRASKNLQKPELMTAPNNAFIDSPVISRAHAALTGHSSPPAVYIADNGSMHGTLLNGNRLDAHRPTKLKNGDLLQFGADVTRDNGRSRRPAPLCPPA